jgi:hypothetical protein
MALDLFFLEELPEMRPPSSTKRLQSGGDISRKSTTNEEPFGFHCMMQGTSTPAT